MTILEGQGLAAKVAARSDPLLLNRLTGVILVLLSTVLVAVHFAA